MCEKELLENVAWVQGLARALLRDPCLAEDVAQEVMAAALARRGRAPAPGRTRAWLAAVTRNLAVQALRREGGRSRVEEHAARAEAIQDTTERAELHHALARAVLELDELYRTVLMMRYFDDLPPREIARRLGLPGTTVRKRLSRGLAKLNASLRARPDFREERWLRALVATAQLPAPRPWVKLVPWGGAALAAGLLAAVWLGGWLPGAVPSDAPPLEPALALAPEEPEAEARPTTPILLRLTGLGGDALSLVTVGRAVGDELELLGETDGEGRLRLEGPRQGLWILTRRAPPLPVDVSRWADTRADEDDEARPLTVDAGVTFIGAVVEDGQLTSEVHPFRLHVDARRAGLDRVPQAVLDSAYVELSEEGDFVLDSETSYRSSFSFWGLPEDEEVLLLPPPGRRLAAHPFGERYGDGEALQLVPPKSIGLFVLAPAEEQGGS